jgi:poly(3-hydroxybutyrate) depolymerase
MGVSGTRRYRLFRPAGIKFGEKLPLMVMLHGCSQDANRFAACTRMNVVAARERFLVLYPEQDRLSNPQGCWNWYDTKSGRAHGEAALIMQAIDQVCVLYAGDRSRCRCGLQRARAWQRWRFAIRAVSARSPCSRSRRNRAFALGSGRNARPQSTKSLSDVELNGTVQPPLMSIRSGRCCRLGGNAESGSVWADAAGASVAAERERRRGNRYSMTVTDFKRQGRTISSLVLIDRLGHAWSGGGANERFSDSQGPDASRMVWAFSARQFARRDSGDGARTERDL